MTDMLTRRPPESSSDEPDENLGAHEAFQPVVIQKNLPLLGRHVEGPELPPVEGPELPPAHGVWGKAKEFLSTTRGRATAIVGGVAVAATAALAIGLGASGGGEKSVSTEEVEFGPNLAGQVAECVDPPQYETKRSDGSTKNPLVSRDGGGTQGGDIALDAKVVIPNFEKCDEIMTRVNQKGINAGLKASVGFAELNEKGQMTGELWPNQTDTGGAIKDLLQTPLAHGGIPEAGGVVQPSASFDPNKPKNQRFVVAFTTTAEVSNKDGQTYTTTVQKAVTDSEGRAILQYDPNLPADDASRGEGVSHVHRGWKLMPAGDKPEDVTTPHDVADPYNVDAQS